MLLRFSKMHGLGNDLMVLDLISQYAYIQPQQMRAWSDRSSGVGFRRLALIEVPQHPDVDFSCRLFDAHGVEVNWLAGDLCCVARLVADKRLISKARMRIEVSSGVIDVQVHADGSVSVPLTLPSAVVERISIPRDFLGQTHVLLDSKLSILSMHGTHAVVPVADLGQFELPELAKQFESHPELPHGSSITALQILDRHHLRVTSWLLGDGAVEYFHYGLCAAGVWAMQQGWANSKLYLESACTRTGAYLQLAEQEQCLYFTGSATRVYEGQIRI